MRIAKGQIVAVGAFYCVVLTTVADADDPSQLVFGVSQIVSPGAPGPVFATDAAWWPIAAGDDDSTFPSTLVLAREYGSGRAVVHGHDGLIVTPDPLDNATFLCNTIRWLDATARRRVGYSTGHSEWVGGGGLAGLANRLGPEGYVFQAMAAPLTSASLANVSVLIAGNAWSAFSESEIEAVHQFVSAGGGLWMVGLGWSWLGYHTGTTMDDFPMMKLAVPYGVRWLSTGISDPTNQYQGSPVFHTFYPNIQSGTVYDAMDTIYAVHQAYPTTVHQVLETNATLRQSLVRAHQTLVVPVLEFPADHYQRQEVFDFHADLVNNYPNYYGKITAFNKQLYPTSACLRERFWRTWRDCVLLTATVKQQMVSAGRLTGSYRDIFETFDLILLDNVSLDAPQLECIYTYFARLPAGMHNMRAISVYDFLGTPPLQISLDGLPGAVNIFGVRINSAWENSFPPDVAPGHTATFAAALAHEVNHVVNNWVVGRSPQLSQRHAALIAQAGNDHLNYLRSMFPDGFFVGAPQEFFASIANEWFTDSAKAVELGVVRINAGRLAPINQALFFADVYSQGTAGTYFYTIDTAARQERQIVPLRRNNQGYINRIDVNGRRYRFTFDSEGWVRGYEADVLGDYTGDGAVHLTDFSSFYDCLTGPRGQVSSACNVGDFDGDDDIDLADFAAFAVEATK